MAIEVVLVTSGHCDSMTESAQWGVDLMAVTPKCDIFLESPSEGLSHGLGSRQ